MNIDIDRLLREYYQDVRGRMIIRKPRIDYYILAKYNEGVTSPFENIQMTGMMVGDHTIYQVIGDSRVAVL
jgi:hypothetical protein